MLHDVSLSCERKLKIFSILTNTLVKTNTKDRFFSSEISFVKGIAVTEQRNESCALVCKCVHMRHAVGSACASMLGGVVIGGI